MDGNTSDSFLFPNQRAENRRAGRLQCIEAICQFGQVVDLSKAGAKVIAKKAMTLPEGASVNLRLEVMGSCMLVPARPVVNRKRPDGKFEIGFQFLHVDDRMGRALIQMMRTAAVNHEYKPRKSA